MLEWAGEPVSEWTLMSDERLVDEGTELERNFQFQN